MKWLAWLVLALLVVSAIYGGINWWRSSGVSVLEKVRVEEAAREAQRATSMRQRDSVAHQEKRLQDAIAETRRKSAQLDVTLKELHATADAQRAEHKRIAASGTMDDALALGRKLGYDPKPCN